MATAESRTESPRCADVPLIACARNEWSFGPGSRSDARDQKKIWPGSLVTYLRFRAKFFIRADSRTWESYKHVKKQDLFSAPAGERRQHLKLISVRLAGGTEARSPRLQLGSLR